MNPNDLWSQFRIVTFVGGLHVYHVHKSHDHATKYVGGVGSSVFSENDPFDPCDP